MLSPLDVREIFSRIPDDDCELMWMDPKAPRLPRKIQIHTIQFRNGGFRSPHTAL